jgi:hypothetical protein
MHARFVLREENTKNLPAPGRPKSSLFSLPKQPHQFPGEPSSSFSSPQLEQQMLPKMVWKFFETCIRKTKKKRPKRFRVTRVTCFRSSRFSGPRLDIISTRPAIYSSSASAEHTEQKRHLRHTHHRHPHRSDEENESEEEEESHESLEHRHHQRRDRSHRSHSQPGET